MGAGKISAIAVLLVSFFIPPDSIQAKYSGGDGEPNTPYQIANVADLLTLAADTNDYNKCFVMTADIDLDPCLPGNQTFTTAVIARDINSSNTSFDGIAFTGIFDGEDHKISNLTIDAGGLKGEYLGFFGCLGTGVVKNLGIENVNITAGASSRLLGGLVGTNQGTISNCFSVVNISAGNNSYDLGGLTGANNGSISYCYSTGVITGGESSSFIGGLVGYVMWGPDMVAEIRSSFSTVNVTAWNDSEYIGGFVGYILSGETTNCFSLGVVSGGDGSLHLGGLIGGTSGSIINCYSASDVTCGTNSGYIGGLTGANSESIKNSYSTGIITGGSGSTYLGGLTGYSSGPAYISNCFFLDGSGSDNGYGEPLTDEQMRQQGSFVGWDFLGESQNGTSEIWIMQLGAYPALSIFNGYSPAVLAGSGTINNPWLVSDACDLGTVYYNPQGHYKFISDVNLEGITWTTPPMPHFYGTLDGNGHKISNLVVTGGVDIGLFGDISAIGAVVKNLVLENITITGVKTIGGLAGINNGTITKCCSTGTISGVSAVGGLAGYNAFGTINECYSASTIVGGADSRQLGGLVGFSKGDINNCSTTGVVTGGDNSSGLGGIVGESYGGYISNSFSTCDVNSGSNSTYLGGIVGRAANISNCSSTGTITGGDGSSWLGGLAGVVFDDIINNCSSNGTVSGGNNSSRLGGLVGENHGVIEKCFSEGAVTGGEGASGIGGLVGENNGRMIMNSYSTGAVTGGAASSDIGGLVGRNYYHILHIECCYSAGAVSGTSYLGGLLGHNLGGFSGNETVYFLDEAGPNNGYGTPLTDAQMKQQASFYRWDFVWETANGTDDIWAICEGVSYPKLAWQYIVGDSDNDKNVDFVDFSRMAPKWLQADSNFYCGGTDLTGDGWVDWNDLVIMCDYWLKGL